MSLTIGPGDPDRASSPRRIVVVGSYATGLTMKVARIPGAGETLLGSGYRVDFGGKGSNQAVGCARLETHVDFVARIGSDTFGDMALGLYRQEGIDIAFVQRSADTPTGVGFIVVEAGSGQNCIVLDPGANELLSREDVELAAPVVKSASILLTQLEIPVAAAEAALALGRSAGAITILNPAPVRPLPASVLSLIDVLTPNETEARVLAGRDPKIAAKPESVAADLLRSGVKQVIMTLGEKGALLFSTSTRETFSRDRGAGERLHRSGRRFQRWIGRSFDSRREYRAGSAIRDRDRRDGSDQRWSDPIIASCSGSHRVLQASRHRTPIMAQRHTESVTRVKARVTSLKKEIREIH